MPTGKEGAIISGKQNVSIAGIEISKGALVLFGVGLLFAMSREKKGAKTGGALADALLNLELEANVDAGTMRAYMMHASGFNPLFHINKYPDGSWHVFHDNQEINENTIVGGAYAIAPSQARKILKASGVDFISDVAAMNAFLAKDIFDQLALAPLLYKQYGGINTMQGLGAVSDEAIGIDYFERYTKGK